MMRRLMTIVIMLLMLSSCYYFNQVVDDIKESAEMSERSKKNGSGAVTNEKHKDGVKEAVKDILKRSHIIKDQPKTWLTLVLNKAFLVNILKIA